MTAGSPPWPLETYGLVFGEPLSDLVRRRLALRRDLSDEHLVDGEEEWTNATGSIRVSTCDGLIGLVNLRESALLGGVELVGTSRQELFRMLGYPTSHGSIFDLQYEVGEWTLTIGFEVAETDCVSWLFLMRGDLYDEPEGDP